MDGELLPHPTKATLLLALAPFAFGAALAPRGDGATLALEWRPAPSNAWDLVATGDGALPLAVGLAVDAGAPWTRSPAGESTWWADLAGDGGRTLLAARAPWDAGAGPLVVARFAGAAPPELGDVAALVVVGAEPASPAHATVTARGVTRPLALRGLPSPGPAPGEPLPGLDAAARARFERGRGEFDFHVTERDGLGPAFNDQSCFTCHRNPAVGGSSERSVVHVARRTEPDADLRSRGGPIIQQQGVVPAAVELVPSEAEVQIERISPHLFGSGLVEAIPDAALEELAAAQPAAVRGRVHRVAPLEGGGVRVGRFGWKANFATLLSFTADAAREELGQTNRLLPDELAPNGDPRVLALVDHGADPELRPGPDGTDRLDALVDFQRALAPPPQTPASGHPGEAVFAALGCATCHHPRFRLPADVAAPFGGAVFAPYSDYLLHDLGEGADGIGGGDAGPTEMRTAPLWGLAARAFLWHDGRVSAPDLGARIAAAVELHGGQGAAARDAFGRLTEPDRALLVDFLQSLGRAPHDLDGNGAVDGADGRLFAAALASDPSLSTVPWRTGLDLGGDGHLDPEDVVSFLWSVAEAPRRRARLSEPRR